MAGNSIRVNTDQVEQIAAELESLNTKLKETLEESKATIVGLESQWEGEAAQETMKAYNEFAAKYFQSYEDIIKEYVLFLRRNVAEGYFETETTNIGLADAFR